MAATVPVQELVAPPELEVRRVSHVLLGNRKFVLGATIFLVLLLWTVFGTRIVRSKEADS